MTRRSRDVKEFTQVEDFDRDIKAERDEEAGSATPGAVPGAVPGAGAGAGAATVETPAPATANRPKPPPTSDMPTAEEEQGRHHYYQSPSSPYSPRQLLTPPSYEPSHYNSNFVDDSSNRHIILHNDDPADRLPTPAAAIPTPHDQQRLPPFSQRWHTIKRVLTLLSMVWSVVILVLSCLFAVHGGLADGVGLWSLPITITTLLWNSTELIVYCVRRSTSSTFAPVRRGMHPSAHVGGHLCFWLTCALAVYLSSSVYSDVVDTRRDCNAVAAAVAAADGVTIDTAGFDDLLRGHCNSNYHFASNLGLYREGFYVPSLQTLLAMFVLATGTHFALFVRACVEVDQRNQLRFDDDRAYNDNNNNNNTLADAFPTQEQYRSARTRRLNATTAGSYYEEWRTTRKNKNNRTRRTPARGAPEMTQQQQYV
ncbi:hypothetical protein PG997_015196 [Apiospora hydei]|uniref:Uncharacterized protein n=1 Tax=Apiospora hydei TaxID=1337664 RepID=A0ABR1UVY2_9PEZI